MNVLIADTKRELENCWIEMKEEKERFDFQQVVVVYNVYPWRRVALVPC